MRNRRVALSGFSLMIMMYVHEAGHLFTAWVYGVEVEAIYLIPKYIDGRFGVGVKLNYASFPSPFSLILCLLAGLTVTLVLGFMVYYFSDGELKILSYVWLMGALGAGSYDLFDVGLMINNLSLGLSLAGLSYGLTAALFTNYIRMIKTTTNNLK